MTIVRPAKPEDVRRIKKIQRIVWLDTYVNSDFDITKEDIEAKDFESPKKIREMEESIRKKGKWHLFVAEESEIVVGFSGIGREADGFIQGGTYVLPKFQKKGIGTLLVKRTQELAKGSAKISCEVVAFNLGGIMFWEKRGFFVIGESEYELPTGKKLPLIKMVLLRR